MKKVLPLRLKIARDKTGWTQDQVSEKLNISIGTLSGYERGYRSPNPEMLARLASLYGVLVDWLVGNSDDPAPPRPKQKEPSHEEYVLAAKNLADTALRLAELLSQDLIDEEEYLRINKLAVKKFPLRPAKDSPKAAHLEVNVPGTGVFDKANGK